jgi:signal transduction histidine kinase
MTSPDAGETNRIADSAILVVDDNIANVELLCEILRHDGYTRVEGESDPRKVMGLCAATAYDLFLLDIRMPYINGFELMEQIKAHYAGSHVPVLVLTAQTDQDTRRRALQLGAADFLTKPFIAWELLHRVRNVLEIRALYCQVEHHNRVLEQRVSLRTAELSAALDAARQADRAKLDFLSVMSHELRTPLNSIIGFAEMIAGETLGPLGHPDYVEYARLVEESGRAQLMMVNNILEYTRGATGSIDLVETEVWLTPLLATCLTLLASKAAPKDIVMTILPGDDVRLYADRRRLREMLLSLLDNAVKFNHPGGHVGISVRLDDDTVTVSVSDDGPGIPPDIARGIFAPFTQGDRALDRQHDGIGIGLAIVRRFAELHGGRVDLDTGPDHGTRVSLVLPASRVIAAPSAAVP